MNEHDRLTAERRLLPGLESPALQTQPDFWARLKIVAGRESVLPVKALLQKSSGYAGLAPARVLISAAARTGESAEALEAVLQWAQTVSRHDRDTVNTLVRAAYVTSEGASAANGKLQKKFSALLSAIAAGQPELKCETDIGLTRLVQAAAEMMRKQQASLTAEANSAETVAACGVEPASPLGSALSITGPTSSVARFERCEMEVCFSSQVDSLLSQLSREDLFDAYDGDGDQHHILIEAEITRPDSVVDVVPGFLSYNPATDAKRWLIRYAPPKTGDYEVRVRVDLSAGAGNLFTYPLQADADFTFTCTSGTKPGPLQKAVTANGENPAYFYREAADGTRVPFLGKGFCRAWVADHSPDTPASQNWPGQPSGAADQESFRNNNILAPLAAAGGNLMTHWLAPWETMLVHHNKPTPLVAADWESYSHLDQDRADRLDRLVENAEANEIALLLCLWPHPALRDLSHSWSYPRWDAGYDAGEAFSSGPPPENERNGFSGLGSLPAFFNAKENGTDLERKMWLYQKNLYRYIVARWGYSRAVGPWEVVSEIQGTEGWRKGNSDPVGNAWHDRVLSYFRVTDWVGRPCASSTHDATVWTGGATEPNDYLSSHVYLPDTWWGVEVGQSTMPNINDTQATWNDIVGRIATWSALAGTNRPALIGEFGLQEAGRHPPTYEGYYFHKKYNPTFIHYALWAGLLKGNAVLPLKWNDGTRFGEMTTGQYNALPQLTNIGTFAAQMDFSAPKSSVSLVAGDFYGILAGDTGGFRGYGLRHVDKTKAYYWIQDSAAQSGSLKDGPSWNLRRNLTMKLSGFTADQSYCVQWWNTWKGVALPPACYKTDASGNLNDIKLPDFAADNDDNHVNRDVACIITLSSAPVVSVGTDAQLVRGATFSRSGNFVDSSSAISWTASVDYGDGTGTQSLSLNPDKTFALNHAFNSFGTFVATVSIANNLGATGCATLRVVVDDRYEVNDTRLTATDLTATPADDVGHEYADLYCRKDDWYKISVPAEKNLVEVKLAFAPGYGPYDLDLYLYDSSGGQVAYSWTGSPNECISTTVAPGNDYYVRVTPGTAGASNAYKMTVLIGTNQSGSITINLPEILAVELPNPGDTTIRGDAEPLASLLNAATADSYAVTHNLSSYAFPIGGTRVTWSAKDGATVVGVKSANIYVFPNGQLPVGLSKDDHATAANNSMKIARDSTGRIHMVWLDGGRTGKGYRVMYRQGQQDATTGAVTCSAPIAVAYDANTLMTGKATWNSYAAIAVSADVVHFAWLNDTAGFRKYCYRRYRLSTDTWEDPKETPATTYTYNKGPDMAVYGDDVIHLLTIGGEYVVSADGGNTWSKTNVPLPAGASFKGPAMSIDSAGNSHVVFTAILRNSIYGSWDDGKPNGAFWDLRYIRRNTAGEWVDAHGILSSFSEWRDFNADEFGDDDRNPNDNDNDVWDSLADWADVSVDAADNVHVVWHGPKSLHIYANDEAFYARRPAAGSGVWSSWETPISLYPYSPTQSHYYSYAPSVCTDAASDLALPVVFFDTTPNMSEIFNSIYRTVRGGRLEGEAQALTSMAQYGMSTWFPCAAPRLYRHPNRRAWLDILQTTLTPFNSGDGFHFIVYQRSEVTSYLQDATSQPPAQPANPSPADQAVHIPTSVGALSWDRAVRAVNYDVFFGTDATAVLNATTATAGIYLGRIADPTHVYAGLAALPNNVTHFWRVDALNGAGTTKGAVWRFTTGTNVAPAIQSYLPDENPVYLSSGITKVFAVFAADADGHGLSFVWKLDQGTGEERLIRSGKDAVDCAYTPASPTDPNRVLTVTVSDGYSSTAHSWTLITNNPPTGNNQTVYTPPNTAVDIILTASDLQNDPLTYCIAQKPSLGTITGTAPLVVYTPPPGFEGTDSFKFRAYDGKEWSREAVVTLYVTLTGNMAAHWKLDETGGTSAADSSGNGNHGILQNFPTSPSPWVVGKIENALQFNGNDDRVSVANSPTLQIAGDLTIALWLKPAGFSKRQGLICKNYKNEYDLIIEKDTGRLSFYHGDGAVEEIDEPAAWAVVADQWQHVAVRRLMSTKTLEFYLNGVPVGSTSFSKTPKTSTLAVAIGRRAQDNTSFYFQGLLDDVRIYNRALSAYAIQTLAQASPVLSMEWSDGTATPKTWAPQVGSFGDSVVTTFSATNKSSCAVDLKVSAAVAAGHETQKWALSGVSGLNAAVMEALSYSGPWVSLHGGNRSTVAKSLARDAEKSFDLRFTAPQSSAETSGSFAVKLVVSPD